MDIQLSQRTFQPERVEWSVCATRVVLIGGSQGELTLLATALTDSGLQVQSMLLDQLSWSGVKAGDVAVLSTGEAGPLWQEVVQRCQARLGIPVLALVLITARVSDLAQLGADEVAFLPLRMEELRARIDLLVGKARQNLVGYPFVERRRSPSQPLHGMTAVRSVTSQKSGLVVNDRNKQVMVDGRAIHLSPMLYKLLLLFCSDPGRLFSVGEISAHLWPRNRARPAEVQQYIYLLRKRLEKDPRNPEWVLAKPGFGYSLNRPAQI